MTTSIKGFAAGSAMLAVLALCLAPARAQSLTVPLNVRIPAELTAQITSLTAKVGDTFAFRTTKDEKLGDLDVPAGTLGHGRVAVVSPAHDRQNGTMALQADSIDLSDGRTIWVNVDNAKPMRGHLSNRHTHFAIVPLPIGVVPITRTSLDGNMVLEPGTSFTVVTIAPRPAAAPLMSATAPP